MTWRNEEHGVGHTVLRVLVPRIRRYWHETSWAANVWLDFRPSYLHTNGDRTGCICQTFFPTQPPYVRSIFSTSADRSVRYVHCNVNRNALGPASDSRNAWRTVNCLIDDAASERYGSGVISVLKWPRFFTQLFQLTRFVHPRIRAAEICKRFPGLIRQFQP